MPTAPALTQVDLSLTDPALGELLEELLWTLPDVVSVTHRMDGEECYEGLMVLSSDEGIEARVRELLAEQLPTAELTVNSTRTIAEEDWAESWKQYWHVNRILPRLVIQPSWETFTPEPDDIVLNLDPGSAFGTGTHETTQLMLWLLSTITEPLPIRMIDVGTGSGILAIYAAKRGFSQISATDNDAHAVAVAEENAERNGVLSTIAFSTAELEIFASDSFPLIVANILAGTLCELMPQLKRILSPGGQLMLGGITRLQLGQMQESLIQNGLRLKKIYQKGDWLALVAER